MAVKSPARPTLKLGRDSWNLKSKRTSKRNNYKCSANFVRRNAQKRINRSIRSKKKASARLTR